jgi:hypothetical protein
MKAQLGWALLSALCAVAVATSAIAGDEAPNSGSSASTATPPAAQPTESQSPTAQPPTTRGLVAIVVTQPLKDAKWNREWGAMFTGGKKVNDLAEAITLQTQAMLTEMGFDSKVVDPSEKPDGVRFYLTPVIKQAQQTTAVFAFSRVSDTLVVEWRVANPAGDTQLLDTVVGAGESAIGNVFTAQSESKLRFQRLMDDLSAKSKTLLAPVLTHP